MLTKEKESNHVQVLIECSPQIYEDGCHPKKSILSSNE